MGSVMRCCHPASPCSACPFPGLQQDGPEKKAVEQKGLRQASDLDHLLVPGPHSLSRRIYSSERSPGTCMLMSLSLKFDNDGVRPGVGSHLV